MLQLKNSTPFATQMMLLPDREGIDTLFTVVKATFRIADSPVLADEQVPVTLADEYHGEPATSSLRAPSDVTIGKMGTDVVVNGTAWAPGGSPTWQMDAAVSVGPVSKRVRVFGDRVWEVTGAGSRIAWVAPFIRMPLAWERAFGGSDLTDKGPVVEPRNPAGIGFHPSGSAKSLAGMPLPNVEEPGSLIGSPSESPAPAGFAAVAAHWLPRRSYAGTYDDQWIKNRAPYLPADFDLRFCQIAPSDLVTPGFLQGGERVHLHGMTPSGILGFSLPLTAVQVRYELDNSSDMRPAVLDTVIIEPDEARLMMVWRAGFRCDKNVKRVREVTPMLMASAGPVYDA